MSHYWSLLPFPEIFPQKGADHFFRLFMNTPLQGVDFYQGENTSGGARFRRISLLLRLLQVVIKTYTWGLVLKEQLKCQAKGKPHIQIIVQVLIGKSLILRPIIKLFEPLSSRGQEDRENSFYVFPNFKTKIFGINATYYFSRDYNRGIETTEFHTLMQELDEARKR